MPSTHQNRSYYLTIADGIFNRQRNCQMQLIVLLSTFKQRSTKYKVSVVLALSPQFLLINGCQIIYTVCLCIFSPDLPQHQKGPRLAEEGLREKKEKECQIFLYFKVGDEALKANKIKEGRKGGLPDWTGPYVIDSLSSKGVASLSSMAGTPLKQQTNCSQLKPFNRPDFRGIINTISNGLAVVCGYCIILCPPQNPGSPKWELTAVAERMASKVHAVLSATVVIRTKEYRQNIALPLQMHVPFFLFNS